MGTQFCHAEGSPSHLFMVDKQPWAPLHPLLWKCHLTAESSSHRKGGSCSNRERGRQEEFCTEKTEPRSSKSWEQPGPRVPPSCPGISPWLHSSWQREKPHSPSGEFWESCNQSSPPLHPKLQCLMFSHFTFRAGKKEEVPSHVWVGICEMWGVWGAWGGVLDPPISSCHPSWGKTWGKEPAEGFSVRCHHGNPFPSIPGMLMVWGEHQGREWGRSKSRSASQEGGEGRMEDGGDIQTPPSESPSPPPPQAAAPKGLQDQLCRKGALGPPHHLLEVLQEHLEVPKPTLNHGRGFRLLKGNGAGSGCTFCRCLTAFQNVSGLGGFFLFVLCHPVFIVCFTKRQGRCKQQMIKAKDLFYVKAGEADGVN